MTTTQPETAIDLDVPPTPTTNRDRRYLAAIGGLGLGLVAVFGMWVGEITNRPAPPAPEPPTVLVVDVEEDDQGGAACFIQVGAHTVTEHVTGRKVCEWMLPADGSLPPRLVPTANS